MFVQPCYAEHCPYSHPDHGAALPPACPRLPYPEQPSPALFAGASSAVPPTTIQDTITISSPSTMQALLMFKTRLRQGRTHFVQQSYVCLRMRHGLFHSLAHWRCHLICPKSVHFLTSILVISGPGQYVPGCYLPARHKLSQHFPALIWFSSCAIRSV